MAYLVESDFTNILEFTSRINQNYSDFIGETLRALNELFHLHFSCYVILDKDIHNTFFVREIKSNTMWPVFQELFKHRFYKEDGFLTVLPKLRFSKPDQHAFFWDDSSNFSKPSRDYLNLLASHDIAYAALVGASPSMYAPMHVLMVYKTASSGPFTEHERELLEFIGQAFSNSIKPYKTWLQMQQTLSGVDHLLDSFEEGYGILSENGTLIYHNHSFFELASLLTHESQPDLITQALTAILPLPLESPLLQSQKHGTVFEREIDGIVLKQQAEEHFSSCGHEILHYVSVSHKTKPVSSSSEISSVSTEIMLKYGLTIRESEVLHLLTGGANNHDIAKALFVSDSTVRSHIRNIYSKLGVSSRMELLSKVQPNK